MNSRTNSPSPLGSAAGPSRISAHLRFEDGRASRRRAGPRSLVLLAARCGRRGSSCCCWTRWVNHSRACWCELAAARSLHRTALHLRSSAWTPAQADRARCQSMASSWNRTRWQHPTPAGHLRTEVTKIATGNKQRSNARKMTLSNIRQLENCTAQQRERTLSTARQKTETLHEQRVRATVITPSTFQKMDRPLESSARSSVC